MPPSSSTPSAVRTGRSKRESPLDLSVKTVRQSADSTAKDDLEGNYSVPSYSPSAVDHQPQGKLGATTIRSRTPQQAAVPMPLQLPSSVAYPTLDPRGARPTSSNTPAVPVTGVTTPGVGAPKVNFHPNFGVPQHNSAAPAVCVSDNHHRSGGRTSSLHQLYSQPSSVTPLPHVSSFKKNSSSTVLNPMLDSYEPKQPQFYSALSHTQNRHTSANSTSGSAMLPPYSSSSNNQYPPAGYESAKTAEPVQNYGGSRLMDTQSRGPNQNNAAYAISSVALGQKRGGETRHTSPAKVPRLDTWKQTIDQQIEQRLSSYSSSKMQQQQQQVNGNLDSARHDLQYPSSHHHHRQSSLHHQSQQPNHQHNPSGHARVTAQATATSTNQHQHGYHPASHPSPYVPSPGHQQYPTPHVGSQPVTHQPPSSRSHAVQRLLTSPSSGLLPQQAVGRNNTGGMADKRVLSILRNSLEIKEARMTELQNQLQQNQLQQQQQQQQQQYDDLLISTQTPSPLLFTFPQPLGI